MTDKQNIATRHGKTKHLPQPVFNLVVESVPIVCVDIIPVKEIGGIIQLGVITRATGPESGKMTLIGGRIMKNEDVTAAIKRHLIDTIGAGSFEYHKANSMNRPFRVVQYPHIVGSDSVFDMTKHSIAMTYLVTIEGNFKAKNEASNFYWVDRSSIPEQAGYNQQLIVKDAFEFLAQLQAD